MTAPGKALGAVFVYLGMSQQIGSWSPKPAKCGFNLLRASRTGLVFDTSIA